MKKRVLVTGAAGFIGSNTSQRFLERGDVVVGLDNFNSYYSPARKWANVDEVRRLVPEPDRFNMVEGDIRDRELVWKLFAEYNFDAVVHLGAMAGVHVSVHDPYLYYDVNVLGTLVLLDAARDHHVGNFVMASTSSVYGRTDTIPFVEEDRCDRPLAPYPASKRAMEMVGYAYHHMYGLNVTVLRFFSVYGPRGRPDMMAYKVLDNIFSGREVPIYNDGDMHRDWTYIDDIVSGVVAAADRQLGYDIINLGRGKAERLGDFVELIEGYTGRQAQLLPTPMMDTDIQYTYADVSKARALLGYAPSVDVHAGLGTFWQWYRDTVLAGVR